MINLSVLTLIVIVLLQSANTPARGASSREEDLSTLRKQAASGDVKAQVQLGLAYASGDGVAADGPEAVKWFRKAADQRDPADEYYLGELYATGRGVPVDDAEALKWLRKAAEQGEPHAQYNLAAMYTQGLGVSKDDSEAAKWMRKAADQGLPDGQFGLGSMYAHGKGVPQSVALPLPRRRGTGHRSVARGLLRATAEPTMFRSARHRGRWLSAVDRSR